MTNFKISNIIYLLKIFTIFLYGKNIIPNRIIPKKLKKNFVTGKIFYFKRKIKYSNKGYFYVNPLPSQQELNSYYKNYYWEWLTSGSKMDVGINRRDLEHYKLLKEYCPELYDSKSKILNFGAGDGGISHLFWNNKSHVVNIDPSPMNFDYPERWEQHNTIFEITSDNSFDLIYGSHSLHLVSDIKLIYEKIIGLLKPNGYIFWEIPNGQNPANCGCNYKIKAAHTYYLTRKFFKNDAKFKVILNQLNTPGTIQEINSDLLGRNIRYLGKKI